ncbi:ABC transporter permease [Emticicia sp. BO119]|uniref:ABC transporter permease n=1 Tax=Emticicia sp. BO119 TaxID=2757768 RepID=UPI0015F03474|nr:ABC transporter permease [Emticicia sp. BO119]MBA4850864.1 ABC transporter permease [Emticicia sp. BO119]
MIRNYLKIAFRNLRKQKGFTFINIAGLAIGITCFLLIGLYVKDELSYDRFNKNADRIYRVTRVFKSNDGTVSLHLGHVAPAFMQYFQSDFSEAEQITRLFGQQSVVNRPENPEKKYQESSMYFAEANIFKVFSFNMLSGNPDKALVEPFTVVLSKPMAEKYFGSEDPIGKLLKADSKYELRVTGVFEPLPTQSHFHADFLLSMNTLNDDKIYGKDNMNRDWGGNNFATYFLMPKGYDMSRIESRMKTFLDTHLPVYDGRKGSQYSNLIFQKLTDIHLYSHLDSEHEANGNIKYVYTFSAIAFFILLIACINYMNLATARSAGRAKEVGLRKVVGAIRAQLIGQFLSESLLLTLFSLAIALVATVLLIPALNDFTNKSLTFTNLFDYKIILLIIGVIFFTGILAGSYPAFFLTAFQPVEVLKGKIKNAMKNGRLRQVLVVMQFSIAYILIISTAIIYKQLSFMLTQDVGYKKDQVIVMRVGNDSSVDFESFKQELKRQTGVKNVSHSSRTPTGRLLDSQGAKVAKGDSMAPTSTVIKALSIDHDYLSTYELKLVAGRDFSRDFKSDDSTAYILNEAAVKSIGWKSNADAIDEAFEYGGKKGKVVGVVKDFHFESLHQKIVPMVMFFNKGWRSWLSINMAAGDFQKTIANIEKTFKVYMPDTPFSYQFLDERFNKQYEAEQKQRSLFMIFAGISIFISCLGLFALAAFMAEQRRKEIGVRKVLGASVGSITTLLSKDFIKLVVISILIASPIAWYAMSGWLTDFAYRIDIEWWIFPAAGLVAILIAVATVSYQAISAALVNPVKSLKSE